MTLLALSLLACQPAPHDSADTGAGGEDLLQPLLEQVRDQADLPALAGAVVDLDGVVHLSATGLRSRDDDAAVTSEDRWHLGSNGKAITATLVATWVDEGELSWSTTLPELFPDLQLHEGWASVTLEMLLSHRGGVVAEIHTTPLWAPLWADDDPTALRAWLAGELLAAAPTFTPGTQYRYSNAGYMLVGAALEERFAGSFEAQLTERVLAPLGMSGCGFGAPGTPGLLDQPLGHGPDGAPIPAGGMSDNPPPMSPAGTLHCDLQSWSAFATAHLAGHVDGHDLLASATWRHLHAPAGPDGYALGWLNGTLEQGPVLAHSGSNTLWFATIWLLPERERARLVVTNTGEAQARLAVDDALARMGDLEE